MNRTQPLVAVVLVGTAMMLVPQWLRAAEPGTPDLPTILTRLEAAQEQNRVSLQAYEVTRQYDFYAHEATTPDAKVIADVQFVPPYEKRYSIQLATGADHAPGVVKKILDREVEATRNFAEHELSRRNYDFRYLGQEQRDGVDCYKLQLIPRHKDKDLVEGTAWISTANYLPVHLEGSPAKSPSWWVKQMHIALQFGSVNGMWLQTASWGEADIRIFGEHTVKSYDLQVRTADPVAAQPPQRRARPEAIVGAALPRE